jgi:hypothetical protein
MHARKQIINSSHKYFTHTHTKKVSDFNLPDIITSHSHEVVAVIEVKNDDEYLLFSE